MRRRTYSTTLETLTDGSAEVVLPQQTVFTYSVPEGLRDFPDRIAATNRTAQQIAEEIAAKTSPDGFPSRAVRT